jgi:ATP-dependent protease ClpP protease subunit
MRNDSAVETQELLLGQSLFEKPIKHYKQIIPVTIHHIYINGEIEEEADRYIDMLNEIKLAEAHDHVFIYLNTPGGSLSTTIQIMSAIKQSQATVTTVIEGDVASAGTFIFLCGDDYIVHDNCSFMVHNYSHGPYGKGHEVAQRVKFTEQHYRQLIIDIYKDFLTDEEIEDVLKGMDVWLNSEQVRERIETKVAREEEAIQEALSQAAEAATPKKPRGRKKSSDTE